MAYDCERLTDETSQHVQRANERDPIGSTPEGSSRSRRYEGGGKRKETHPLLLLPLLRVHHATLRRGDVLHPRTGGSRTREGRTTLTGLTRATRLRDRTSNERTVPLLLLTGLGSSVRSTGSSRSSEPIGNVLRGRLAEVRRTLRLTSLLLVRQVGVLRRRRRLLLLVLGYKRLRLTRRERSRSARERSSVGRQRRSGRLRRTSGLRVVSRKRTTFSCRWCVASSGDRSGRGRGRSSSREERVEVDGSLGGGSGSGRRGGYGCRGCRRSRDGSERGRVAVERWWRGRRRRHGRVLVVHVAECDRCETKRGRDKRKSVLQFVTSSRPSPIASLCSCSRTREQDSQRQKMGGRRLTIRSTAANGVDARSGDIDSLGRLDARLSRVSTLLSSGVGDGGRGGHSLRSSSERSSDHGRGRILAPVQRGRRRLALARCCSVVDRCLGSRRGTFECRDRRHRVLTLCRRGRRRRGSLGRRRGRGRSSGVTVAH